MDKNSLYSASPPFKHCSSFHQSDQKIIIIGVYFWILYLLFPPRVLILEKMAPASCWFQYFKKKNRKMVNSVLCSGKSYCVQKRRPSRDLLSPAKKFHCLRLTFSVLVSLRFLRTLSVSLSTHPSPHSEPIPFTREMERPKGNRFESAKTSKMIFIVANRCLWEDHFWNATFDAAANSLKAKYLQRSRFFFFPCQHKTAPTRNRRSFSRERDLTFQD